MARRSWRVGPDQVEETPNGPVESVSIQRLLGEVGDALIMANRAGGTVSVLLGRKPTGRPGEMVTSEALVTWQDRADAKAQYEEPIAFEDPEPVFIDPPMNGHVPVEALAGLDQED